MKDNRSKSTYPIIGKQSNHKKTFNDKKKIIKKITEIDTTKFKDSMSLGKSNILVAVRCRPLNNKELEISKEDTIQILNRKVVCVIDPGNSDDVFKNKLREQQYAFDYAFEKDDKQVDVYDNTTKFLLTGILEGFNATIFAYGATGAGKTYTMLGTGDNPGIMVRSLSDLFSMIEKSKKEREFKIKLSYVEVYNETLRDLIEKGDNLEMREDPTKGSHIAGLSEIEVVNVTEVFKLLLKGNKNRTTEATNANESSSRSHAVLQISVDHKLSTQQNNENIVGKFILVDLAGSERAANTHNTGMRLVEGGNINRSLLNLGNCINALVEISNGAEKTFVPWRNSKLTRILKDSLGGNSRIIMIANISPSIFSLEETLNTLKYANRAKNIKTSINRNVLEVDYHINKYDDIISNLKSELENLRHQLAIKTHNMRIMKPKIDNEKQNFMSKFDKANKDISDHFIEEIKTKKEIINTEKKMDYLSTEIKETEYELQNIISNGMIIDEKPSQIKKKDLRDTIKRLNEDIKSQKLSLNELSNRFNDLVQKREELQLLIAKYHNEPLGKFLNLALQNFLFELDNLELEQKKSLNIKTLQVKELRVNKLIDQLKLRDQLIDNIKTEFSKNGIKNLKTEEKLTSLANLNVASKSLFASSFARNSNYPPMNMANNISNNSTVANNFKQTSSNNRYNPKVTKSRSNSPREFDYQAYNNPNIRKEKIKIKTKATELLKIAKKNELTEVRMHIINRMYPNSKLVYSNERNKKITNDNSLSFHTSLGKSRESFNSSGKSLNKSNSSNLNTSIKERELEKKIKNTFVKNKFVNSSFDKKNSQVKKR